MSTRRSTRGIVALLLCVIPLSQFPIDVYTPAIPTMSTELGATVDVVQASVAVYVLGLAVAQLPVGILADAYGRRRVLLVCLAMLAAASVGTALAPNIGVLLAFRFFEGIGGAACMVIAYAIAADVTRGARLAALSGMLGASWGLAPVVAPAIGGVLVEYLSWRGIFFLVATLAGLALLAVLVWLPETLSAEQRTPVRLRAVAQVVGVSLRHRVFVITVLAFAVFGAVQLMFGIVAPLLYQVQLGLSPALYGVIALVIGAANLAGELTTGALATRVSHRMLGYLGLASFVIGAAFIIGGGLVSGTSLVALTIGGIFALYGCGTLCPLMFGRAMDLFTTNLGLVSGLASGITYLAIAGAMLGASALPDSSSVPLGVVYIVAAVIGGMLLRYCLAASARR